MSMIDSIFSLASWIIVRLRFNKGSKNDIKFVHYLRYRNFDNTVRADNFVPALLADLKI